MSETDSLKCEKPEFEYNSLNIHVDKDANVATLQDTG